MMAGGLLGCAAFVPFTLAHGPTSHNLEREVLGWDMHHWGFLLGTIPPLLVGAGLWWLRARVADGRRTTSRALAVMSVAMFLFAGMNAAFRALGPPFDLFLLGPASVVAALTAAKTPARATLRLLAAAYSVALASVFVPLETSDIFGGFRIFGAVAYAGAGVLWAAFGTAVLIGGRRPPPD